jgi:hypothetical protein
MPYNLLMPEEKQKSLRPRWVPLWVWQWRWWIGLGALFILVWLVVPPWLYRHTGTGKEAKLKAITDTRTALLAGLIGVGALLAFWLSNRVYRIMARTLEVTEQGQITERYTKAIEQLGQAELAMRLGGIYALERIAKDSERDHPTVVEVLSAFVRDESRKQRVAQARQEIGREAAQTDTPTPESGLEARPATDIQAVLTVLGRLPHRPEIPRADLSEAHLPGARLDRANLSGASLERARLPAALLMQANLSAAGLGEANLSAARLDGANLSGAHLGGANLFAAMLYDANLAGASLDGAKLSGARLDGADLRTTGGLRQAQLDAAHGDGRTQLPVGLQRPDSWATGEESAPASS